MPPMITDRHYTTKPRSELSDADLAADLETKEEHGHGGESPASLLGAYFQRLLAKSIALR
jgi:hypothetical protein